MPFVDLHTHSHYSDGAEAPADVVARAVRAGATALAITDHDTVGGVAGGREAATAAGLDYLSGVEVSSTFERQELHVVGLGIDDGSPTLLRSLDTLAHDRRERFERILARLAELGVPVEVDPSGVSGEGVPGRLHIARALRDAGYTRTTQEGFDGYIGIGRPAYVPKRLVSAEAAVAMVHEAGGLAFVAHPGLGNAIRRLLPRLLELPFDGIEAYHVSHSEARTATLLTLARDRGLLVAGGSDCHGAIKDRPLLGSVRVPRAHYDRIRERLGR